MRLERVQNGRNFRPAGRTVARDRNIGDEIIAMMGAIPLPVLDRHAAQHIVFECVVDRRDIVEGDDGQATAADRRHPRPFHGAGAIQ